MPRLLTAALLSALLISPAFAQRMLSASPFHPAADGYASITLTWAAPPNTPVEIHLASPSGDVVSAAASSGSLDTGPWVTDGTRFFLQDITNGSPGITLASLTIRPGPTPRPFRHYIAVLAGAGTNPSYPVGPAVLVFDRDTLDQLTRVTLPAAPFSAVAAAGALYVSVGGTVPGVFVFDLVALAIRDFVPLPITSGRPAFATGANGVARILFPTSGGVALLDPATNSPAGSIACSFAPQALLYNPANQTTYGLNSDSPDLCVITPQFRAGTPVHLGRPFNQVVLLPDLGAGTLLLTAFNSSVYTTLSFDLDTGALARLPALDNVRPALVVSRADAALYAAVLSNSEQPPLQRFAVTFPSASAPVFTPQFPYPPPPAGSPALFDGRFLYTNILGNCSTLEGPVFGCSGGFTLIDPATLRPAASVILGSPNPSGGSPTSAQSFGVAAAGTLAFSPSRPPSAFRP